MQERKPSTIVPSLLNGKLLAPNALDVWLEFGLALSFPNALFEGVEGLKGFAQQVFKSPTAIKELDFPEIRMTL